MVFLIALAILLGSLVAGVLLVLRAAAAWLSAAG